MSKAASELFKLLNRDGFYEKLPYVRDRDIEKISFEDSEKLVVMFLRSHSEVCWYLCQVCAELKPKSECKSIIHHYLGKENRYIVCDECLKRSRK